MKEVMVSVIVPIYNVRTFINRGIEQLQKQTYKDYEVLLVDDGSTDGSFEECKSKAFEDPRIRVLHQENKGAGGARNLGIENAKGKYIYFYDIDDTISPLLLKTNVEIMEKYMVDMLVFGYTSIDLTYNSETTVVFPHRLIQNNLQLRDIYVDEFVLKVNGFPWNKFYRSDFLNKHNLRFEDQRIQQDEVFNLLCYQYVEKMYVSSDVLYTYYVYNNGNTRSRYIPERFDIYKSVRRHFENLKTHWGISDKRFDDYLNKRFYDSVMSCLLFNLMHKDCPFSKPQKKQAISNIMDDPQTKEAFDYASKAALGFEQSIYRHSCKKQSIWRIKLWVKFFSIIRTANIKLRELIC